MRTRWREMLSGLEVDVLRLYVEGKSYQEIGEQLGRHVKSIDNALQRIKRKLDQHLQLEAAHEADELLAIGQARPQSAAVGGALPRITGPEGGVAAVGLGLSTRRMMCG